jgi:outer membrane protein, heavy metal efflux system
MKLKVDIQCEMRLCGWMFLLHRILLAAAVGFALPAFSQEAGVRLTMEGAVQSALLNNRDLRAARYAVDQARGRLVQAGRWANPEIEVSGMSDFAFGNKGEAAFSVGLYQTFPLTSRLGLSRQISRLDVERALREIRNYERILIERVQSQYIELVAGRTKVSLWRRIDAQQKELADAVKQRLESGQGSSSESALAAITQSTAWNGLSEEQTAAELALIDFNTLLGMPAGHPLELTDSLDGIIGQLRSRTGERPGVLHRPDADLVLLDTDRADLEIRLARAEAWEGIRIGVEYTNDRGVDAPEGLGTDQFLGLNVSIPLPVWNNNQGSVAEKQALRDEMQARLDALRLEIANELAAGLRQAGLLQQRYEEIQSRGVRTLQGYEKEMRKGFEEGRVDLRDWLAVRSQLAEMEIARESAAAELARAYARLLAITGGAVP